MIYLISYDNNNTFGAYPILENEIKKCGFSWWHHMNYTWIIRSNLTAKEINKRLLEQLRTNDALLVIELLPTANYRGWLKDDAWKWIRKTFLAHLTKYSLSADTSNNGGRSFEQFY